MSPADAFVPVPLRWRHVIAWDLIPADDGSIWAVTRIGRSYGPGIEVSAMCGPDDYTADVDPDEVVNVLVPVTERDAVELTREQLGARLVERRTA